MNVTIRIPLLICVRWGNYARSFRSLACRNCNGREDSKESCPEQQSAKQLGGELVGRGAEKDLRFCESS